MISDRAEGEGGGGERERGGSRGGWTEGGGRAERIEERNQRRLSAYEVGIVGWRRPVLSSLRRIIRRGPRILVARGAKGLVRKRQMFFLNGDELVDK